MRTRLAVITLSLLLGLGACGGGDTHESLANESLSVMEEMATIVEGMKDKATADAAKPKLEALVTKMRSLKERADKLPKKTAEQEAAMTKDMATKMGAVSQRFGTAVQAVQDKPEVVAVVQDVMQRLAQMGK